MITTQVQSVGDLGAAIRAARKRRRWTQAQLAARTGTGLRLINEVETGKRTAVALLTVLQICHVVGIRLQAVYTHVPILSPDHQEPPAS